jgi:hypothetical protein
MSTGAAERRSNPPKPVAAVQLNAENKAGRILDLMRELVRCFEGPLTTTAHADLAMLRRPRASPRANRAADPRLVDEDDRYRPLPRLSLSVKGQFKKISEGLFTFPRNG